jgi:hypothetical protein
MAMEAILVKLNQRENIVKFCKDASQFTSPGSPLIEAIVDLMVWAHATYFVQNLPLIPSQIATKIALALKKLQAEDTRLALQKNKKTGKDYYVKEDIDPKK